MLHWLQEGPSHSGEVEALSQEVLDSQQPHHFTSPPFGQEEGAIGEISWVVTPDTPQGDIEHQVDNVSLIIKPVVSFTIFSEQLVAWHAVWLQGQGSSPNAGS